jgi:UDP-glucose 4-epimerase
VSKYLITGVAGFIGSAIARELVRVGHQVRGVDNLSSGKLDNLGEALDKIDFIRGDILETALVESACSGVDCVFHEAAIASVQASIADPIGCDRVDAHGTVSVLTAARNAGVRRVVYAASASAYGDDPALPKQEDMLPRPISPYAAAKLAGEMYMSAFHAAYGLETVALRYFNVFGPYQDPTSDYSGVITKFITAMIAGRRPTIFGDGLQSRDFVPIANIVSANLLASAADAADAAGKVFNIGMGESINLQQLCSMLNDALGTNLQPLYEAPRPGDIRHSRADITRARTQLGYEPRLGVAEGLKQTVAWYATTAGKSAR